MCVGRASLFMTNKGYLCRFSFAVSVGFRVSEFVSGQRTFRGKGGRGGAEAWQSVPCFRDWLPGCRLLRSTSSFLFGFLRACATFTLISRLASPLPSASPPPSRAQQTHARAQTTATNPKVQTPNPALVLTLLRMEATSNDTRAGTGHGLRPLAPMPITTAAPTFAASARRYPYPNPMGGIRMVVETRTGRGTSFDLETLYASETARQAFEREFALFALERHSRQRQGPDQHHPGSHPPSRWRQRKKESVVPSWRLADSSSVTRTATVAAPLFAPVRLWPVSPHTPSPSRPQDCLVGRKRKAATDLTPPSKRPTWVMEPERSPPTVDDACNGGGGGNDPGGLIEAMQQRMVAEWLDAYGRS